MTNRVSVLAVLTCVLAFISLTASAADVQVTWVNPTQRVDGSSLPVAELRGTRVEHGTCNGALFGTKNGEVIAAASATSATIVLGSGLHCFRAYARASDGATGFLESVATNVVSRQVLPAPPNPPGSLVVQQLTAFTLVKSQDRLVMLPVGTVPGDTACIGSQVVVTDGVTYHAVPTNAVTFSGSVRPVVVFARCS